MKKVVVIEDNADNMRLITYVLQHAGYQVVPAWSGEEGVEAVENIHAAIGVAGPCAPGETP
jgi:CheY-like chemotaxis protein